MGAIEDTGRETLAEMRRILGVLRHTEHVGQREPQPGVAQIYTLIQVARERGQPVELSVDGEPGTLPAGVDLGITGSSKTRLTASANSQEPPSASPCASASRSSSCASPHRARARAAGRPTQSANASRCAVDSCTPKRPTRTTGSSQYACLAGCKERSQPDDSRRRHTGEAGCRAEAINVSVRLIADDQQLIRTGFRMILAADPDIEVVGEAANGAEAVTLTSRAGPGRAADGHPHARARRHRGHPPDPRREPRAEATRPDPHHLRPRRVRLRRAARRRERIPAQRRPCAAARGSHTHGRRGRRVAGAEHHAAPIEEFAAARTPTNTPSGLDELTPREREILKLLATGMSTARSPPT